MGRGRKGLIEQSERKKKASGAYRETFTYISVPNREIKKIPIPQQAFEFMKNMNPQQPADVFCQTTTTGTLKHRVGMLPVIKYSTCKFKFVYM